MSFSRVVGLVLVVAGIVLLFHPNIPMPAKKSELHVGSTRAIIETRRIVSVPKAASWIVIGCGGLLVLLGARRS
jgi:hypothetical protein